MDGLQSGSPASSLSPQNFKNSNQTGSLQGSQSITQVYGQAQAATLTSVSENYQLQVVTSGQNNVLGVSGTLQASSSAQAQVTATQQPNIFPILTVMIISVILGIFFFKKYRQSNQKDNNAS